jgi:hypothetical protein
VAVNTLFSGPALFFCGHGIIGIITGIITGIISIDPSVPFLSVPFYSAEIFGHKKKPCKH